MDEINKTEVTVTWDTSSEKAVIMNMKIGSWSNPQLRLTEPDVDQAIKHLTAWKENLNVRR